jgi:hypothetical protein
VGRHRARTKSQETLAGGVLLGAVASGLAAAALSGAGTASGNCASISGIGNGPGAGGGSCTSSPGSFAIGLGPNTTANANGVFNGAVAYGLDNGVTDSTVANANGSAFDFALASGKNTLANANNGFGNLAIAQGTGVTSATPGGASPNPVTANAGLNPGDAGNVAINLGGSAVGTKAATPNITQAGGTGNIATNFGGSSTAGHPMIVQAFGLGNAAFNGSGSGNIVSVGNFDQALVAGAPTPVGAQIPVNTPSSFGVGFNALGQNNIVTALGPSIAGTLGVNDHNAATPPPAGAFSSVFAGPGTINIHTTANP